MFALRATDPRVMLLAPDPIGPGNDEAILADIHGCRFVVAAWGNHGAHLRRGRAVREIIELACVTLSQIGDLTSQGEPRHPLYLPAGATLRAMEELHG